MFLIRRLCVRHVIVAISLSAFFNFLWSTITESYANACSLSIFEILFFWCSRWMVKFTWPVDMMHWKLSTVKKAHSFITFHRVINSCSFLLSSFFFKKFKICSWSIESFDGRNLLFKKLIELIWCFKITWWKNTKFLASFPIVWAMNLPTSWLSSVPITKIKSKQMQLAQNW